MKCHCIKEVITFMDIVKVKVAFGMGSLRVK